MTESIGELAAAYRSTAVAWDVMKNDSSKSNRLLEQLHGIYKQLRDRPDGRGAIIAFLDDDNVAVRLMAATHCLAWEPDRARIILEAIERDGPGLYRTDAKYTLKAFREGRLNLDW
jgi:uncharacterized protein DUF2019